MNLTNLSTSFRCLAVGRSHSLLGKSSEALALFSKAFDLAGSAVPQSSVSTDGPPQLDVTRAQVNALGSTLRGMVAQYRGLVTLERLSTESGSSQQRPLVERMHQFSLANDLNNLVPYPPQMQPVPVKPLFLDVAWNYINYPQEGAVAEQAPAVEEKKGRGWFGFGR